MKFSEKLGILKLLVFRIQGPLLRLAHFGFLYRLCSTETRPEECRPHFWPSVEDSNLLMASTGDDGKCLRLIGTTCIVYFTICCLLWLYFSPSTDHLLYDDFSIYHILSYITIFYIFGMWSLLCILANPSYFVHKSLLSCSFSCAALNYLKCFINIHTMLYTINS